MMNYWPKNPKNAQQMPEKLSLIENGKSKAEKQEKKVHTAE